MNNINNLKKSDHVIEAMQLTKCFLLESSMNEKEIKDFAKDCKQIIEYLDKITKIKLNDSIEKQEIKINVCREDKVKIEPSTYTNDLLNRAKDKKNNYIKVKKIL